MKILFFGTPNFAEIVLQKLLESRHQVVGVVCQTDKPTGRGNKVKAPHIVDMAKSLNLPVFQFEKLKEHVEDFKAIKCDIGVTASYGKIIPKCVLDVLPIINVHPSLLPKYRGATPIQTALLNGDQTTGVTIMKTDVGMDDGDIFVQKECAILPEDDYFSLEPKLAEMGADLLLETLDKIQGGTAERKPQNHNAATFVKMIAKEDSLLDFSLGAQKIVNKIRAFCASPVAYFFVGGQRIKVQKAKVVQKEDLQNTTCHFNQGSNATAWRNPAERKEKNAVGTIIPHKKRFLIESANGIVEILRCQAEGGKMLDAAAFLNGYHFKASCVDAVNGEN